MAIARLLFMGGLALCGLAIVLVLRLQSDEATSVSTVPPATGNTVEFGQADEWTKELRAGREVIFDGVPAPADPSSPAKRSLISVSAKSLGALPSATEQVLRKVVANQIRSEEYALSKEVPAPTQDPIVQTSFSIAATDAAASYERLTVIKRMLEVGDYLTIKNGVDIPCPRDYTKTTFSPYFMEDGTEVTAVFLIPHQKETRFKQALEVHREASRIEIDNLIGWFNIQTAEERQRLAARDQDARGKLEDPNFSRADRSSLMAFLLPDQVQVVNGILVRKPR